MKRHCSLTRRLVLRTLLVEVGVLIVVAVIMVAWLDPPVSPIYVWFEGAFDLVRDSITFDADGTMAIMPTADLREYVAQRPTFLFAAVDLSTGHVIPGSSPDLIDLLPAQSHLMPSGPQVRLIVFTAPTPEGKFLEGGSNVVHTRYGDIEIFVYGSYIAAQDRVRLIYTIATQIARYAVPALALTFLVMWLTVRRAMMPLRAAGAQASEIDFRRNQARLPDDDRVPRELLPLVQGVNRALERLNAGFRRQQRFTANAAHEMRTPLGILRARIDSLDGVPSQGELRRDAQRITAMIDQLLAIARLEQNGESFETFDLGAAVADVVSDLAPLALDGDRLLALVPPPRPILVHANLRALQSALGNLVDNALHAEPEGGTVVVAVADDGSILVTDHGPGIRDADREMVFEPFWRGDEARLGTGLGLAIVREIATLHGGTVVLSETPGGGATFRLSIPVRHTAGTEARP